MTAEAQNVLAVVDLKNEMDLTQIAMDIQGIDYDPETGPFLLYRTQDPKATVTLYESGKMQSIGADSVTGAEQSIKIFHDKLKNIDNSLNKSIESPTLSQKSDSFIADFLDGLGHEVGDPIDSTSMTVKEFIEETDVTDLEMDMSPITDGVVELIQKEGGISPEEWHSEHYCDYYTLIDLVEDTELTVEAVSDIVGPNKKVSAQTTANNTLSIHTVILQ